MGESWRDELLEQGVSEAGWRDVVHRLGRAEARVQALGEEQKKHSDELAERGEWWSQMGIRTASEMERRNFSLLLRWWTARVLSGEVRGRRMALWIGLAGVAFTALQVSATLIALTITHSH